MEAFRQDIRHAVRMLMRNPGFAVIAILALALGIGPNAAIFSVVNALLLTPPPYQDPDTIVSIFQTRDVAGLPQKISSISTDDFQVWRTSTGMLEQMAVYAPDTATLTGVSEPVRLTGERVSPGLFPLLRVKPLLGRVLRNEEEKAGSDRVVVLSYSAWVNRFGSDRDILNRFIKLDGNDYAVVGVMPVGFDFPNKQAEYWAPLVLDQPQQAANVHRVMMMPAIARLKPGVTIAQAQAEGTALLQRRQPTGSGPFQQGYQAGTRAGRPGTPPAADMVRQGAEQPVLPAQQGMKQIMGPAQPETRQPAADASRQGAQQAALPPQTGMQQAPPPAQPDIRPLPGAGQRAPASIPSSGQAEPQKMPAPAPQPVQQGARQVLGPALIGGAVQLATLQEQSVKPVRPALLVLMVAVGLVLLVACANVANLLLSRAVDRQKEISIRASLGAGRGRIIRQMLTESVLLALLGGMVGLLLGFWGIMLLPQLSPGNIQHLEDVRIDMRAMGFSLVLSLLTGVLFGLAPALKSSRSDLMRMLKEGEAQASAGLRLFRRNKTRSLLVVVEFALALILLVGAGLLANSFVRLVRQNPGYNPDGVLTLQVSLPRARYPQPEMQLGFFDQLLDGMRSLPGVQAAGTTNMMPMSSAMIRMSFQIPGAPQSTDPASQPVAGVRMVSPGFIPAMAIRLINGRDFTDGDRENGVQVAIVNESMVRRFFPGANPIGRQIDLAGPREIVGVVADVRPQGLDSEPQPELYLPHRQFSRMLMLGGPLSAMSIVMRSKGDPLALVPSVRARVAALDSQLPIFNVSTLKQRVSNSVAQPRFYAVLLGIFAGLALLLAAVGIYGVFSYQVAQCTREIGIRMALGAQRSSLLALVLREGALLSALGIILGLAGAWAGSRYLSSLLFGIAATDTATYGIAAVLMAVIAIAATYVPARRAIAIDPVTALRQE
ncbi:MAG: ADOP family duplicated permease [Acidobacteriia bacterium]|nr:ADOP family duplicated permease [Terriglobia bacterium]